MSLSLGSFIWNHNAKKQTPERIKTTSQLNSGKQRKNGTQEQAFDKNQSHSEQTKHKVRVI